MYKNKFFIAGSSSSDEDTSDDEQPIQVQTIRPDIFHVSYKSDNDDEEDVKRTVRSKKDKCDEEIQAVITKIKQAMNIGDINQVYECFENLIKTYDKARRIFEEEQSKIPQFYIEILIELDNFVNQYSDNKTNSNNLNILRQKLHRYLNQQSINIHHENEDPSSDETDQPSTKFSNEEEILKKLDEIISIRGKRGINYEQQIQCLTILRNQVEQLNFDTEILIKVLLIQITFRFDSYQKGNEVETWTCALDSIEELLKIINQKSISCDINDDLISLIVRMDEEFRKILQNIDPHSHEYIERLKDEIRICSILDQFKLYFELNNQPQYLCLIYLSIIEHTYYKINKSSLELINQLCKYIYINDTLNHSRTRASLCQVYYFALHDYYDEARDLMLMSHIQDTIQSSDISTQILYNRTIVQLGLSAFRCGEIQQAYQTLVDIQSRNCIKELLGHDYLPYHMHINLQLTEWIYLISAMLVETLDRKKHSRMIMKQTIIGPPESMREHIVAASHAMKAGEWKTCVEFLINEKTKNTIWKLIPQASNVIQMLIDKIKEESLRIYLSNYATNSFSTISIPILVDRFELSMKKVYEIISKLIINQQLMASIDESNEIILMHETNSSKIGDLSNELVEKIFRLYDLNKRK